MLGDQRMHLSKADSSFDEDGAVGGVVFPREHGKAVDEKVDFGSSLVDLQLVKTIGFPGFGNGVGPQGHKMKAVAFSKVAGVEASFVGLSTSKVGEVKGVDVSVVVLSVRSVSLFQGGVKEVFRCSAPGCEKEHGQTGFIKGAKLKTDGDVVGENQRAPVDEVGPLSIFKLATGFESQLALWKRGTARSLHDPTLQFMLGGEGSVK